MLAAKMKNAKVALIVVSIFSAFPGRCIAAALKKRDRASTLHAHLQSSNDDARRFAYAAQ
jgi:hypothetical protein